MDLDLREWDLRRDLDLRDRDLLLERERRLERERERWRLERDLDRLRLRRSISESTVPAMRACASFTFFNASSMSFGFMFSVGILAACGLMIADWDWQTRIHDVPSCVPLKLSALLIDPIDVNSM